MVDVLFEVCIGFCAVWRHSVGGVHLTDPTNLFSFLISGTTTSQICKYIHIHMHIYDLCYIINGGVQTFLFVFESRVSQACH